MSPEIASPKISVCIPAYNRAQYLPALLDSIYSQDCKDFEIVICEDRSREREQIAAIARDYAERHPNTLCYYENETNLGYDANVRNLVATASGEYCFFMGNDDLMCPGALAAVADILGRHSSVGVVLKSYAWFDDEPAEITQAVRYFKEERVLNPGRQAISVCFRRSGVLSGYIVHRESARSAATNKFDGTLFYQMHLTANVLIGRCAVATPQVLVLCRSNELPEFGSSNCEKGMYTPGRYTPDARISMVAGALSIIKDLRDFRGIDAVEDVTHDFANYFYPYIKDQLDLPFRVFIRLYGGFGRMGFAKYPMFHLYCVLAYLLGERRFDLMTKIVRSRLGRSPQFGFAP